MIPGFDRAQEYYDNILPPEPREPDETIIDMYTLTTEGYSVQYRALTAWSFFYLGEIWGDSYYTEGEAWEAAKEHHDERQPELCEECGNQSVCPDCVGT
jgi:hypothetical protein